MIGGFKKIFFNRTISRDLILGLTTTLFLMILIVGTLYYFYSKTIADKELKTYADDVARSFSISISYPMYNFEVETVRQISRAFLESEILVGVIVSVNETIVFEKTQKNIKNVFKRNKDVFWNGDKVAKTELYFSKSNHEKKLKSLFYLLIFMFFCLVVSISAATHLILKSFLKKPLKYLTKGIENIARGNYSESLVEASHRDINLIINEINQMSDQIIKRTRQLAESEQKYRTLFENAVEGIYKTTLDGFLVEANPVMAEIFGYSSPDDLIKNVKNVGKDLYFNEADREKFLLQLETNGRVHGFEVEMQCRDKSKLWVESSARSVCDEKGKIKYLEGFIVDISQRKQMEIDLRKAHDELERRVRERTSELEEKTVKLERINKLFVDRELSMKELKKEIKEVKLRLAELEGSK